jgi:uncharacterized protein (TIGR04255 family)
VLSLQFHHDTSDELLESLEGQLAGRFSSAERLERTEAEISVGGIMGEPTTRTRKHFEGWRFKNAGPSRVLQATRSSISLHEVRPGKWPVGPYLGWPAIAKWAMGLLASLSASYTGIPLKRVALRYLNRIAVPDHSPIGDWLTFAPSGPHFLRDLYAFSLGQTWSRVEGHDHLSATVRLVKIEIEDQSIAKGNQGVMLDIEVFNLWIEKAPAFTELAEWFEEAHAVENRIFESYVTPTLRDTFGEGR